MAGIFVKNAWCGDIRTGYDTKTRQLTPFADVIDMVRSSVIKEYRLLPIDLAPFGSDPLQWLDDQGGMRVAPGMVAFRKRYPQR
jgi:hypothetical protein